MTNKDELIKAAETLKNYCEEHTRERCYFECLLSRGCLHIDGIDLNGVMEIIIRDLRSKHD